MLFIKQLYPEKKFNIGFDFLSPRLCSLFFILILVGISPHLFPQQLHPGDKVKLTVYNISDARTEEYFVQEDGAVYLPYVGLVTTSDRPIDSVRTEILSKYNSIYQDLEIHIQLFYKVNILGEIDKPGVYYVTGAERVSDLLAMAGGDTRDTNLKKIILIRQNTNKTVIDTKEILKQGKPDADVLLQSGDKIYVPRSWFASRGVTVVISSLALMVAGYNAFRR